MTRNDIPKAPTHLRPATKRWFEEVVSSFELESHHILVLQAAAESWDRYQGARQVLDKEGTSYVDRFGAPRNRPEVAVERDSRVQFLRALRELALDIEPPAEAPRPPRITD